jgi:hypothetical protein
MFDPNEDIYIYWVNSENIPAEKLKPVKDDNGEIIENQLAVVDIEELIPDFMECKKAIEVEKYYELTNWKKEGDEKVAENKIKPR